MAEEIKILKLKRTASEFRISISTVESPFVVPETVVEKYRLKEGIVITSSQLRILQDESEYFQCDRATARILAMRAHSVGELRAKLAKRKFRSETVRKIIRKYKEQGVLDDAAYARHLAVRILAERPCGESYLVASLQRKKIDRELAEATAREVYAEQDEQRLAEHALAKKWREYREFDLETVRRKAYTYLARRGFGYQAAKMALDKIQKRQEEVVND